MKRSLFQILFFFFLLLFVSFSCKDNSHEKNLIEQAAKLVDSVPDEALTLLDSISKPETMNHDLYMKYIVARIGAKKNTGRDISSDTLIFEAEKYFDSKNDPHLSALAHYYAGNVYYKRNQGDLSLNSFLQARDYAQQTDDYQLLAKSLNNIGYRYLMNELNDSAVAYFKKATDCYLKISETDKSDKLKMRSLYSLGSAYYGSDSPDSAFLYYNQALNIAKKLDDKEYQAILTSHLGLARREQGRYNEALEYLYVSLPEVGTREDSLRIYINLFLVYNKLEKPDSSMYYTDLIETRLSQIENKLLLRRTYSILKSIFMANHLYPEALKYADLEREIDRQIKEENSTRRLLEAEKKYALSQKEKEIVANKRQLYLTYLGASCIILFIIFVFVYVYLRSKKELGAIEAEINRIRNLRESSNENSNQGDLFEWARCCIIKQPLGGKLIAILSNKEVLFTFLWMNGYSKEVIAAILDVSLTAIDPYKSNLTDTLRNAGFTDFQIEEIFDRNKN